MPSTVPDSILDGVAARPDDVGVWEVLSDYLLEQDAPEAALARCDLELMRGISNPELLEQLSEARARRPKLPYEPWGGFSATWRCGFVVRLTLDARLPPEHVAEVLRARATRGLNTLVFEDSSGRNAARDFDWPGRMAVGEPPRSIVQRVQALTGAVTPHLRRLSLRLEERFMPLLGNEQRDLLDALTASLPASTKRVDLALGTLDAFAVPSLLALARRLELLNLDGTLLSSELLAALAEVHPVLRVAGTGLSLAGRDVSFFAPDVAAWLERDDTGAVIPLTPSTKAEGFDAPAWPALGRVLRCELLGWTVGQGVLDDGARLSVDGAVFTLRLRA